MLKLREFKNELISRIRQGEINFFVGAGISKRTPAGIPTGPTLTKQLLQTWIPDSDVISLLTPYAQNGTLRLEVVMQIANETFSDATIVLHPLLSLLGISPNCNHYLLVFALKNGCIVITTNFDVLIEIAYWNLYGSVPQVVIFDDQFQEITRGSLLKLHGSIAILERARSGELVVRDARETIRGALDQVARGLGDKKTHALQQLKQVPTLIWGYSCMDDFGCSK